MKHSPSKNTRPKGLIELCIYFGSLLGLFFISDVLMAQSAMTLGQAAYEVKSSMTGIGKLITALSYISGLFLAMVGLLKFKTHKDNPVQVPLSQPLVLLAVATGLIYLPNVIDSCGETFWKHSNLGRANVNGDGVFDELILH